MSWPYSYEKVMIIAKQDVYCCVPTILEFLPAQEEETAL